MTLEAIPKPIVSRRGEPVWAIAEFFPEQGAWTEEGYFKLPGNRRGVEFDSGMIEVLPVPTFVHQMIAAFLYELLKAYAMGKGLAMYNGYRVRIPTGKLREPDVLYMTAEQRARVTPQFTIEAELVVEVISPDDPKRDYEIKRIDYADAGIPEYWIVDAEAKMVTVLKLENGAYVEHGRFGPGQIANSHRLSGFAVVVDELLAQGAAEESAN